MNGKDLFEAMSHVDERYVDEAESKMIPKTIPWIKLATMAACLCLMVLTVHSLRPFLTRSDTTGVLIEDAQESAIAVPEDTPVGEIPNTILYVKEMTADGFIATVTDWGVTDVLGLGTEWNVVIRTGTWQESFDGGIYSHADSKTDYTGCLVLIQFFEFDEETKTIIVDEVEIIEKG